MDPHCTSLTAERVLINSLWHPLLPDSPCLLAKGARTTLNWNQETMPLSLDSRFLPRRRYLLGISGGRDSVALLHALLEAGATKLILCHLNHQLRGLFSSHDAAFVRNLAESNGLPFAIARANIRRRSKEDKVSIEVAARRARHQFFAECAREHRCSTVLLAHHADDNAETVLLNLLRGSAGLKGMRYQSSLKVGRKSLSLLRPFLGIRRREIDSYLEERGILYRDDASNKDPFTPRNRLRSEVMPLLEDLMARDIVPPIVRAARVGRDEQEALDDLIDVLDLVDPQERLFLPKLRKLPESLQRRALFVYLRDSGVSDLSRDLVDRCLELLQSGTPAKINLPGGQYCRRRAGRIFIE